MACAEVFSGRFAAAELQRFAAQRLLRLAPLPPLSRRLVGPWRRAAHGAGRVAMLALLPEGPPPPVALLNAVAVARGGVEAAYAVWR
jgi:hypothetical protein